VTTRRREPAEPRTPQPTAAPRIPQPQPSKEDILELREPYDLPVPEYPDPWLPRRPEYVIVVDQLRGWQPGQAPSLAELLETGRLRQPEPDLEAEP
jgi:hypothetical protein